ncbi:hypothetical protein [Aureivirga sp. CE67]|uniref:hypothetical protein n=1 Tax=Aureivirga sp. CE67 TaxID=1788983 RepID=UPI0018CA9997|nr:hypothetical protein [Aureivirga sp. CE67]
MKVCIVIPDGVGIRNYLYSDLLKKLIENNSEIFIWHTLSNSAIEEIKKVYSDEKIIFERMPLFRETKSQVFIRELISYSRLLYNSKLQKNETILNNWKPRKQGVKKYLFGLIELYGKKISKNYQDIVKLESYYEKLVIREIPQVYNEYLKKNEVDVVFCTHQRAIQAIPIMTEAKRMGIRTVGAIFSWDNMPKARLSVRTDEYVVWSSLMKEEMKTYYPEISLDKVTITGTPQFEFYNKEELYSSKEAFFTKHNLDVNRKVICYSGDDKKTSPFDPIYLEHLAKEIENFPKESQPQILFRRCPVDLSDRFDKVLEDYKHIIKVGNPEWALEGTKIGWDLVYPKYSDIIELMNVVKHCDTVVNVGSTMAHDFSIHNKPAIYINYDIEKESDWSVDTIYKFQHFRSMPDKNSVHWLNDKSEIKTVVEKALHSKEKLSNKKWFDCIVNEKNNACDNLVNVILNK